MRKKGQRRTARLWVRKGMDGGYFVLSLLFSFYFLLRLFLLYAKGQGKSTFSRSSSGTKLHLLKSNSPLSKSFSCGITASDKKIIVINGS